MKIPSKTIRIIGLTAMAIVGTILIGQVMFIEQNTVKFHQLDYGKPVIVTIAWNNRIYEVTAYKISGNELEQHIGSVERQVSPRPDENGEIARNTPEGPMLIHRGEGIGYLYQIAGNNPKYKIAIELSEGCYTICEYYCRLS